jgi:TrmH family RNA methyltransferase
MEIIKSAENSTIKRVRHLLSSRKYRREQSAFVVEGIKSVRMLFEQRQSLMLVELLVISKSIMESSVGRALVDISGGTRIVCATDELMERAGDVRASQGVMAVVKFEENVVLPDPLEMSAYLLCDRISDPGNMGTLIRTAVGVGFDAVLLFGDSVDVYNPKCVRSTAGTLPFIHISRIDVAGLDRLIGGGYELIAARMDAKESVFDFQFAKRVVIAVGNEAHGLSEQITAKATYSVHIPLRAPCESLNAAIAGSLMMLLAKHG